MPFPNNFTNASTATGAQLDANFAAISATSGSSLVGFISSGTGSTPTTVQTYLQNGTSNISSPYVFQINGVEQARISTTGISSGGTANLLGLGTEVYFDNTQPGNIHFRTNDAISAEEQVRIVRTASATNFLTLTGSAGGNPAIGTSNGNLLITSAIITPVYIDTQSTTAVPNGGSNALPAMLMSSAAIGIYFGVGAPTLAATQGSLYLCTNGSSASTRLYVNTNGSTGWTNVVTGV